jgi:hypothetical protein
LKSSGRKTGEFFFLVTASCFKRLVLAESLGAKFQVAESLGANCRLQNQSVVHPSYKVKSLLAES